MPDSTAHTGLALRRRRETREQIERRVRPDLGVLGQVEIPGRGRDVAMAEQPLNGVHIDTGFQEVRGKGVAERILTLPMNRRPPSFTTDTIRSTANT